VLSLSITKWRNLLNSQSLVYDGDRQAPPDLSNLLPEEADSDPDTWLMCHLSIRAFLCKIANTSNIQPKIFLKESIHIYKILQVLDMNEFPPNVHILRRLGYLGEISPELEKPPTWKDTVISTTLCRILHNAHSVSQWQIFHSCFLIQEQRGIPRPCHCRPTHHQAKRDGIGCKESLSSFG
jgi:hypothetical protein